MIFKTAFSHLGGQKAPQTEPGRVQNGVLNRDCKTLIFSDSSMNFKDVLGPGVSFWSQKTDPKLVPNRIFVAEAFREPLESLLERSWRPQDLKYRSWEGLLAELGPKREPKREPKWHPKTVRHAFGSPRGSKSSPGTHLGSILEPYWTHLETKNTTPKACRHLFACQLHCIQQPCRTAVPQVCAGPATGAHAPSR